MLVQGMERYRHRVALMLLVSLVLLVQHLDLSSSLDEEEGVLLSDVKIIDMNIHSSCSSFAVGCEGGRVLSLSNGNVASRKLLQGLLEDSAPKVYIPYLSPSPPRPPTPYVQHPRRPSSSSPSPSPSPLSPPPPPLPPPTPFHFSGKAPSLPEPSTPITFSSPSPNVNSPSAKNAKGKNLILYTSIGAAVGLLVIVAICLVYFRVKKGVVIKPWATGLSGQLQRAFVTGAPVLKHSELQIACEDFSNIIGSSADCILYKGTLSSGVEIAVISAVVKSSKDWSKQLEAQFHKKVTTLSKVNHKNFVNLLGYCVEDNPFARMMVFEYAPNGTLYDHLHIKEAQDLNWAARLRIAMGIAYCLDYMNQLEPPVTVKNLHSNAVLLTDDCAAKISDTELFNETSSAKTDYGVSEPLVDEIQNQETTVYKYGMLLLEIVSGKLPFSENEGELLTWASDYLKGGKPLKDMIDPSLNISEKEKDVAGIICHVIKSCLYPYPNEKPSMRDVAARLQEVTRVNPDGATPKLSPLWWAELEIISTEM